MIGLWIVAANDSIVVYALSFWHYGIYALAYLFGAVSLPDFKRDAITMKAVSLVALAWVYFAHPLSWISLAIMAVGFFLNAAAAAVLGSDRTYYGRELADLPEVRVTTFPFSWLSHPMLVGNMIAYGGLLFNFEFSRRWWPLAVAHMALNLGLILLEVYVRPPRSANQGDSEEMEMGLPGFFLRTAFWSATGVAVGAALAYGIDSRAGLPSAAFAGACSAAFANALFECYAPAKRRIFDKGLTANEQ